jgi:protein MpaA
MSVQRLWKNVGRYNGETIQLDRLLPEIREAARTTGWHQDLMPIEAGIDFLAFRRTGAAPKKNLYISAGMHGDEPAGPVAVLELLKSNAWPETLNIWLCPCLNPTGFPLNRRENAGGIDINRDYRHFDSREAKAHADWLRQQPGFDLSLCLHEDWESHGFYAYELNPDNRFSFAEEMIKRVGKFCPIDSSAEIDGWPASGGIIRPPIRPAERPQWPEALFLITHKTRQSYTLEAPSDFELSLRSRALVEGVNTVLELLPSA